MSVLWVLLLLSALAASASYTARTEAILVHRELEIAKAEAAADAAVVASLSRLSDTQASLHPIINGSEQQWEYADAKIEISVSRESGRIDLNAADQNILLAFLYSRGVEPEGATALLVQLHNWQTANGPLRSVNELKQITGWNDQPLACWTDALTVYTGLPGVSSKDAGSLVLDALSEAEKRRLSDRDGKASSDGTSSLAADGSVMGEVLRISATAFGADAVKARSVWVGRLTGERGRPTLTMRWDHDRFSAARQCRD